MLLPGCEGLRRRQKTAEREVSGVDVRVRIGKILDRLIELYTATNRPGEAAKWKTAREEYPTLGPPPWEKPPPTAEPKK